MAKCATVVVEKKVPPSPPEECGFFEKRNPRTGECELDMKKVGLIGIVGAVGLGMMLSKRPKSKR